MSNTGYVKFESLEEYDEITGNSTGVTKPNVEGDPDYIGPEFDGVTCPIPFPPPALLFPPSGFETFYGTEILLESLKIGDNPLNKVEFYSNDLLLDQKTSSPYELIYEIPQGINNILVKAFNGNGTITTGNVPISLIGSDIRPSNNTTNSTTLVDDYKSDSIASNFTIISEIWLRDDISRIYRSQSEIDNYFHSMVSAAGAYKSNGMRGIPYINQQPVLIFTGDVSDNIINIGSDRPVFINNDNTQVGFAFSEFSLEPNIYIFDLIFKYQTKPNILIMRTSTTSDDSLLFGINLDGDLFVKESNNPTITIPSRQINFQHGCKIGLMLDSTTYDVYLNGEKVMSGIKNDNDYTSVFLDDNSGNAFDGYIFSVSKVQPEATQFNLENLTEKRI